VGEWIGRSIKKSKRLVVQVRGTLLLLLQKDGELPKEKTRVFFTRHTEEQTKGIIKKPHQHEHCVVHNVDKRSCCDERIRRTGVLVHGFSCLKFSNAFRSLLTLEGTVSAAPTSVACQDFGFENLSDPDFVQNKSTFAPVSEPRKRGNQQSWYNQPSTIQVNNNIKQDATPLMRRIDTFNTTTRLVSRVLHESATIVTMAMPLI
jgi:hypothetical protein